MENNFFDLPKDNRPAPSEEWYQQWQQPEPAPVPAPAKEKRKKNRKPLFVILAAAVVVTCCVITAVVLNTVWHNRMRMQADNFNDRLELIQSQMDAMYHNDGTVTSVPAAQEGYMTPGQVYAANLKTVVAVTGSVVESGFYGYDEYQSFGSGFILTEDGYVVSNYHVVEGAQTLSVITYDDQEYEAELVGYDANNDIALLKIEAQDLSCVKVGSSDALAVGDQVAAVGNPLGELTSTLTVGYISAKDRIITTDGVAINMLQTDAAINSGNSGGPLFNMKGEVVGITSAKYSGTTSNGASIEGIGFAIPIDDVYNMLEDIRDRGYVAGAYLGIMTREVDENAQAYGLPAGVYVEEVIEGYAAQKAGILAGDIIIRIDEHKITGSADMSRTLRKYKVGESVTVTVYRSGQELELTVVLDEKPEELLQDNQVQQQPEQTPSYDPDILNPRDWFEDIFRHFFGG